MRRLSQRDLNRFAARLRAWQQGEKFSQVEAAKQIGVPKRTYQEWVAARVAPQDANIGRLQETCGGSVVEPLLHPAPSLAEELRRYTEEEAEMTGLHDEWLIAQSGDGDVRERAEEEQRDPPEEEDQAPGESD